LRYLDRLQPLALLVLRLVLGAVMVAHGYQKVHSGLAHVVGNVAHLGLPGWLGYLLVATEFLGGMLLIAGLLTRCVAFAMLIDMSVAIWKVHFHNGFTGQGGYEFPLALAAIAFTLIFFGAGAIALDHIRGGGGRSAARPKKS
jgi:putative oxidoreductase